MSDKEFIDYYELMELSPNANLETIERVFRYLATKWHPDSGPSGDKDKFTYLVRAFETLRDPVARAAFDAEYRKHQQFAAKLVEDAEAAGGDCVDRHKLLTLFYAKRRREMKNPGLGGAAVETLMGCPPEILDFHIWYFREKGWIKREEQGGYSITAAGVDRIEAVEHHSTIPEERRIEWQDGDEELALAGRH